MVVVLQGLRVKGGDSTDSGSRLHSGSQPPPPVAPLLPIRSTPVPVTILDLRPFTSLHCTPVSLLGRPVPTTTVQRRGQDVNHFFVLRPWTQCRVFCGGCRGTSRSIMSPVGLGGPCSEGVGTPPHRPSYDVPATTDAVQTPALHQPPIDPRKQRTKHTLIHSTRPVPLLSRTPSILLRVNNPWRTNGFP